MPGRESEGSVSKTEHHRERLMYVVPALLLDSFPIHGWPATHGDKSEAPATRNAYSRSVGPFSKTGRSPFLNHPNQTAPGAYSDLGTRKAPCQGLPTHTLREQ